MPHASTTGNGRTAKRPPSNRTPASPETLDLEQLLTVLTAVRKGDFSVRMPVAKTGLAGKIADTLNEIAELNEGMAQEFERVSLAVGKRAAASRDRRTSRFRGRRRGRMALTFLARLDQAAEGAAMRFGHRAFTGGFVDDHVSARLTHGAATSACAAGGWCWYPRPA